VGTESNIEEWELGLRRRGERDKEAGGSKSTTEHRGILSVEWTFTVYKIGRGGARPGHGSVATPQRTSRSVSWDTRLLMPITHSARLALAALLVAPSLSLSQTTFTGAVPGAARVVIDSATIRTSGARTLAELLSGRVPGLAVTFSSGIPGTAPVIHARGSAGAYGALTPALYVDGLLVPDVQGIIDEPIPNHAPSFGWEMPVEEIAQVEVLLGVAGTAMLDYATPRGAILVTTLRPTGDVPTRFFLEQVSLGDVEQFADNHGTVSPTYPGDPQGCTLSRQALAMCTATTTEQWNPLRELGIYENSTGLRMGISDGGTMLGGNYRLSGHAVGAPSVLDGITGPSRLGGNAAWNGRVPQNVDLNVDLGYARSVAELAAWEFYPFMGIFGESHDDPTFRGFLLPPTAIAAERLENRVERFYGNVRAERVMPFGIRLSGRLGLERSSRTLGHTNLSVYPPQEVRRPRSGSGVTLALRADASHRVVGDVRGNTTVQLFQNRQWSHEESGGSSFTIAGKVSTVLAREELSWGAHRTLGFSLRGESYNGADAVDWSGPLPGVDVSWVISDEPFFPDSRLASRVRLRAAVGNAVEWPSYEPLFDNTPCPSFGCFGPQLTFERTREAELGVDATLLREKVTVTISSWNRRVSDSWMLVPVPAVAGFSSRIANVGTLTRSGTDVGLRFAPLTIGGAALRLGASMSFPSGAEYRGQFLPTYEAVHPGTGDVFWRRESASGYGDLWSLTHTFNDDDSNGIIDSTEVTPGAMARIASSLPTRVFGVQAHLTLRGVEIGAALDGQGGHSKYNLTEAWRCKAQICRALHDPDASLADQARAVAIADYHAADGFIEDASFVRLRELWVRVPMPWMARNATRAPALVLSARNALSWTQYGGVDPEAGVFQSPGRNAGEWWAQPLLPSYSARIEIGW
jgi:hypothetical protein